MRFQVVKGAEPVPGYVLEERIGIGGYGEVWRATAPGGLHKAIKFIFDRLEDRRAESELKSLDRIKHLTHPFLLTLERIECVDTHLAIVTELAEGSLRERFDACRNAGLPGIPRDELLTYLSEAADALDYLSEGHSLQHLDVKPENLLLVGNHVKVADFGLLKDLHHVTASLVSGLTPRYASPEVFDGRPTRHSDQYSLAVMYQELATGQFPFQGQTAAALASQHLHAAPDLSELTPIERFAVGKALAKSPDRRFTNCREFVKRLSHRSTAASFSDISEAARDAHGKGPARGALRHGAGVRANGPPSPQRHDGQTIVVAAPESTSLPALDLSGVTPVYRPTIFLAVGGLGGRVLGRLRQLLRDRFSDAASLDAMQLLYVDTDVEAVNRATSVSGPDQLLQREAIAAPIRDTWDYRSRPVGSLNSISRRWLYNIPRTRQTQGLRALGRLAMMDHSQRILEALKASILAATDKEAIRATAQHTGLAFQDVDPRVFLVASLGGGTGGGMMIDMAYAVRQVLAETGFSDAGLCGILLCSTARGGPDRSLAPANAFTCLEELHYFSLPGNDYPGEPACGLTSFREDGPTLPSTYLIGLGDGVSEEACAKAIDETAMYLFLSSISSTSTFLDACRQSDPEPGERTSLCLRSAGSKALGIDNASIRAEWSERLCRSILQRWQGGRGATEETRIRLSNYGDLSEACHAAGKHHAIPQDLMDQCRARFDVDPRAFAASLHTMLRDELGCDVDAYLYQMVLDLLGSAPLPDESSVSLAMRKLHSVVGIEEGSDPDLSRQIESLAEFSARAIRESAGTFGKAVRSWILERVDAPESRIDGARQLVDWMAAHINTLHADAHQRLRQATTDRVDHGKHLLAMCRHPKAKKYNPLGDCRRYVELLVAEFTLDSLCKKIGSFRPSITACSDQLRELLREVNRLAEQFAVSDKDRNGNGNGTSDSDLGPNARLTPSLAALVADHESEMLDQLDRELEQSFFRPGRRLRDVLGGSDDARAELVLHMRAAARKVIRRCANDVTTSRLREALEGSGSLRIGGFLQQAVEAALPQLAKSGGGGRRLLLMTPEDLEATPLRKELERVSDDEATVICDSASEFRLVYEVEGMSLDDLRTSLIRSRPDCEEIAFRLHTRIDVDW